MVLQLIPRGASLSNAMRQGESHMISVNHSPQPIDQLDIQLELLFFFETAAATGRRKSWQKYLSIKAFVDKIEISLNCT